MDAKASSNVAWVWLRPPKPTRQVEVRGWKARRQVRCTRATRSSRQYQRLRSNCAWAVKYTGTPRSKASSTARESWMRAEKSRLRAPSARCSRKVCSSMAWDQPTRGTPARATAKGQASRRRRVTGRHGSMDRSGGRVRAGGGSGRSRTRHPTPGPARRATPAHCRAGAADVRARQRPAGRWPPADVAKTRRSGPGPRP